MFIYDILHREKIYSVIENNLRTLGIKYRVKKNAFKANKIERNTVTFKKVFNIPLSHLPLDVVNLSSGAIVQVPVFINQAAEFLLKNVTQEGLFRKAGSQARQKEIIARLDNGGSIGDKYSAIDIANCLKTFFRNLPEPLIPYIYHDLLVRCNMLKVKKEEAILQACLLLPVHHLNTLAFFMDFLRKISAHDKLNKMNTDNLARVIGPNIMPLQETTMIAMQSRLDAHLTIIKLLIENADKIGNLPHEAMEVISMDSVGSLENDLDNSDYSFQRKKKKHRSGSLTRMISGLKKIVGKNISSNENDLQETRLLAHEANLNNTSKLAKKRKVADAVDMQSTKKQKNACRHRSGNVNKSYKLSNTNNSNSNTNINIPDIKEYKYQNYQEHLEMNDKSDKIKKSRLSLDRFIPKNRNKISDSADTKAKESHFDKDHSSSSIESKKRRRTLSALSDYSSPFSKIRNTISNNSLNNTIPNAAINLSDESSEQVLQQDSSLGLKSKSNSTKSLNTYFLRNTNLNISGIDTINMDKSEEYIKIPKSEYEEIKNRVSIIESRISQEFKNVSYHNNTVGSPITQVQNEYEKTLEEAGLESMVNTDQLAKRLSRELKIRRSVEHKVIRSPSARKIGSIRRRSQERPVRKLQRTSTWHVSERPNLRSSFKSDQHLNNQPKCNLKRGRPLLTRNSYKNLTGTPSKIESESHCSDETNARLHYLQEQLNTLISQTAEHTKSNFSDDEDDNYVPLDNDFWQNTESSNVLPKINNGAFIDNSKYFNNKIDDSKHSDLEQGRIQTPLKSHDSRKEKAVTWKDADNYFHQEEKLRTPVPQTGRASVAKLRAQNAGMVLAKAKLFDDTNSKESNNDLNTRRIFVRIPRIKELKSMDEALLLRRNRRASIQSPRSLRQKTKTSGSGSPLIKMEVTIVPAQTSHHLHCDQIISKSEFRRRQKENYDQVNSTPSTKVVSKDRKSSLSQNACKTIANDSLMPKTPHIKKPLNTKTPKSAKSISRRTPVHSRRTPLKAVLPITPKRQSPRVSKSLYNRYPS